MDLSARCLVVVGVHAGRCPGRRPARAGIRPHAESQSSIRGALALALLALVAAGCGSGGTSPASGSTPGVAEGTFEVTVQNGQDGNGSLVLRGGTVFSTPAGIACGVGTAQVCTFEFAAGTSVVLTATPVGDDTSVTPPRPFLFLGWSGDCAGEGTCTLSGKVDRYVVATFGGVRRAHPNYSSSAVHGPAWNAYDEGAPGALDCRSCHGARLQGQGIAVGCADCHAWPRNTYSVGGTISGLAGRGLVLATPGEPDLGVGPGATTFTFADPLPRGAPYDVTIRQQPTSPWQTCSVADGAGTVGASAVSVPLTCTTNTYALRATVTGLAGAGLVLRNAGGESLSVAASGSFTFPTPLPSGSTYRVVVEQQPTAPSQTCTVAGGTGTLASADASVAVTCTTNTFRIGGSIAGLAGGGLVLATPGEPNVTVPAGATSFAFPSRLESGTSYGVTIVQQPTDPWQTCAVSNATGTIGAADVTSVAIACTTHVYAIRGTVSGLAGTGLVLGTTGAADVTPSSGATSFAFGPLASGTAYAVTVRRQPTSPSQTCVVSNGTGTIAGADVTSVAVTCTTNTYAVGGTITGLAGSGLQLATAGQPDLILAPGASRFTFASRVESGTPYDVRIVRQPTSPWQTCTVSNAAGTVESDVTSIAIDCTTNAYRIRGTIAGLTGTGLVLGTAGEPSQAVAAGATEFEFPDPLPSGTRYAVTVLQQPTSPAQTCTVAGAAGTIAGADVSVAVTCGTNVYAVGGTVTGLVGSGLVLRDNGGDDLELVAAGPFTFATPLPSGSAYDVVVARQPVNPPQTCTVTGGTGVVSTSAVASVEVACTTDAYPVSVTVSGLVGSGLVLTNAFDGGAAEDLPVARDGTYDFPTHGVAGSVYFVTVRTQPAAPTQTCRVTEGTGIVGAGTNVSVSCTTNAYPVGGSVAGLAGSGLVLATAGEPDLTVAAGATTFRFADALPSGTSYAVTIRTQPTNPSQTCTVANGTGTIGSAAVSSVAVTCTTNAYRIGGTVQGLTGSGLVLATAGEPPLAVGGGATSFTFADPVPSGTAYAVTVAQQPTNPSQTCTVANAEGTVGSGDVTSVVVTCGTDVFTVGGTVTGLTGAGLELRNNGGDALPVLSDGSFTFATALPSGSAYAVTVSRQPSGPAQTCAVTDGSGTVGTSAVASVLVTCTTDTHAVSVTVSGLEGSGLVLANAFDGGIAETLPVAMDGTYAFAGRGPTGSLYSVTVQAQPTSPTQTCTILGGAGTLTAAATVDVTCTTNAYRLAGTVSGLEGTGLVLRTAGEPDLEVPAFATTFELPAPLSSGTSYGIAVVAQPTGPSQTCTVANGAGTIGSADVSEVTVTCTTNHYRLGGTISGLAGSGLVLLGTGQPELTIPPGATSFEFPNALASGTHYEVAIGQQPTSPPQRCVVSNGDGMIASGEVTVAVTCTTNTYLVGGTIAGLAGAGLVLQNNGGDDLQVLPGATTFTFPTALPSGTPFAVTIRTQPTDPLQTCTVTSGTGTIDALDVSASITCTTNTYAIRGTISGLLGNGLVLATTGAPHLPVAAGATTFAFAAPLPSGTSFAVTVLQQPSNPAQFCQVLNGTGVIVAGDVTNVAVSCRSGATTLAAGEKFTLRIRADGTLWALGNNEFGQLGDGTTTHRSTPVLVGSGFASVAAGVSHTIAVKTDGTLWAWGNDASGQLGTEAVATQALLPVQIGSGFAVVAAGGNQSFAIATDGSLWAWGDNSSGQLGDGTTLPQPLPVRIGTGYVAVAAGARHTLAVKAGGTLWAWGDNASGQLGTGTTEPQPLPVEIGSGYAAVAAGAFHSLAVTTDAALMAWGSNASGQLGNGTMDPQTTPVPIGTGYAAVAGGARHTVGVKTDGTLWSWGANAYGQLGDDTVLDRASPAQIGAGFASVAAGLGHTLAVTTDGTLWGFGLNDFGQVGGATTTQQTSPVQIGSGYASVAAGVSHTVAVKADGTVWAWGDNTHGQLGDGTTTRRTSPVLVATGFASVAAGASHTLGVKLDGTLWAWGNNDLGQLGDGSTTPRMLPVQIGNQYKAVAAGVVHSVALNNGGTLYAWGGNANGQLGDGTTTQRNLPVRGAGGYASIAAGSFHTVALRVSQVLYAWGGNASGQLGDGTTVQQVTPVQIGTDYAAVAAGALHTVAVKADGTLWAWGANASGQLGDGSTAQRSSPVQVGTGYASVEAGTSHSVAVKTDGTLWGWGDNDLGQLGDGTTLQRPSPVQVGTGYASVAAGDAHTLGVKTDQTLWAWGNNASGQLGIGDWWTDTPTLIP